jgi:hypothetical protein
VNDAGFHNTLSKVKYAVYPDVPIDPPDTVITCPPATYPVPVTSLVAVYAVVDSLILALAVYKAILSVSVKTLWIASYNSALKLVVWVWTMLTIPSS